jgi:transcriptional regulator, propionate catabolism operon regulatory protein
MEPIRIGIVIATAEHLGMLQNYIAEVDDKIFIVNKGLEEAIEAAKSLVLEHNIEVIVARRGTAFLLRENIDVPVLTIQRDESNILYALHEASGLGQKVLLTEFRNPLPRLKLIEKLLKIHIKQVAYHGNESLRQIIHKAKYEGYSVAVGGGLTVRYSTQCGMHGIELGFTHNDLETTIENARAVARANRKENEETRRYQAVIDSVSEGVVAFDQNGLISSINRSARKLMNIGNKNLTELTVQNLLGETSAESVLHVNRPRIDSVEQIKQNQFLFNHFPVSLGDTIIGGVSTFKDFSGVMNSESAVRRSLSKGLVAHYSFDDIVHYGPRMGELINQAARYAQTDSTVLITGETGTGKELIAQSIHNGSHRRRSPFVIINCAALPENLLESELFGYDEGAFTGSKKGGKAGLLEIAHQGTVFLDEISEAPIPVQVSLLRILQEREVMRLGSDRRIPIDIRIITATNKDLIDLVNKGTFREDLYFRLDVLHLNVPPLRERTDCSPLARHFINKISVRYGLPEITIPPSFLTRLNDYSWPGNVRQLENFIERMVIISEGTFSEHKFETLLDQLSRFQQKESMCEHRDSDERTVKNLGLCRSQETETQLITEALQKTNYRREDAAKLLGISRTTLWKKLKKYGISS